MICPNCNKNSAIIDDLKANISIPVTLNYICLSCNFEFERKVKE